MSKEKWDGIWHDRTLKVYRAGELIETLPRHDIHFEELWWYVYYNGIRYRAEKVAPRTYRIEIDGPSHPA